MEVTIGSFSLLIVLLESMLCIDVTNEDLESVNAVTDASFLRSHSKGCKFSPE